MNKSRTAIIRAKIVYFFKETFRAHSKAEYKEIFSRGLNDDNRGISGAFPWLYVRAFFVLLVLFTVNVLVLRLTNNSLYVPSVNFLGGITFSVPFIILLYELYPKRDVSLLLVLGLLVCCGTLAGVITQVAYYFIPVENEWLVAVVAGCVEEVCKAAPAIIAITILKQKNPYACFLIAASVGAGFSVIEDMGYIFYYSDKFIVFYNSDIQATVALFVDRGLSSFCTHIVWTGAIGWAYSYIKKPFKSLHFFFMVILSVGLHICWDLPLEGLWQVLDIAACVVVAAAVNITIVHLSRIRTLAAETDLTRINEGIIAEAKAMGERMRFTNAANLTFVLMWAVLCVLILLFCAMPIGIDSKRVEYDSKEDFIAYLEDYNTFSKDLNRPYDKNGLNDEERFVRGDDGQMELSYVVQYECIDEKDYYFGYTVNGNDGDLDTVAVEIEKDGVYSRQYCNNYNFGGESVWVFDVNAEEVKYYNYNKNGTVTAVTEADAFTGYHLLIIICGVGCAATLASTVVIVGLRIKLRRIKDAER